MRTEIRHFEILLAEDSAADVALIRQALKRHQVDCLVHVIQDGAEAIKWIESLDADPKTPPLDLVLLDMHLPKRDGEDILRRLRSTEYYAQTPVVVMTGLDSSILEEKATRNAAVVYFRKPSTLDEFMRLGSIVRLVLGCDKKHGDPEVGLEEEVGGAM